MYKSVLHTFIFSIFLISLTSCVSFLDATSQGPIQEDPTKRTFGNFIDDERIETIVAVNIRKTDPELKTAHINVVSFNGVVLLVGQVKTPELRDRAADVADQVRGVRQVHNELTVSGEISTLAITNDAWLTTKIKSKFLGNQDINSRRIKVVTENGVVFLMGLLTRAQADMAIEVARNTGGVQKIVRVFEYVD